MYLKKTNNLNLNSEGSSGAGFLLVQCPPQRQNHITLLTNFFGCFFKCNKAVVIMKNLLKKSAIVAATLVFALGLVFTQSTFKTKKVPVIYQYTNPSALSADIKNIANWEVVDQQTPSCGEEGELVCRYEFEGDMEEFEDFLDVTAASYINENALATKE